MSTTEGAPEGAVHVQDGDSGPHAQVWRARAGDSLPDAPQDSLTLTQRSQELIAARWGKPIEEPPPDTPAGDDESRRRGLSDAVGHLHVWRDPLPSQRAVKADNADGWRRAQEAGLLAAGVYGVFWLMSRPVNIAAAFVHAQSGRPMRFAGLLFVAGLFWLAFKIATP